MPYNETPTKGTLMLKVAFHLGMTVITGGLWLIVLLVYTCVKLTSS